MKRVVALVGLIVAVGALAYVFYKDDVSDQGRLYASKQKLCQEFAISYLRSVQQTDSIKDYGSPTWQMAIDVETDLFNLCLLDLNESALSNFSLSALKKYHGNSSSGVREQIELYVTQDGDSLTSIANAWGVSMDTIKWENKLNSDTLAPGTSLRILPVTGVSHLVRKGDTLISLGALYKVDPERIANWPYNKFVNPEGFELIDGDTVIIPGGSK